MQGDYYSLKETYKNSFLFLLKILDNVYSSML